MEVNLGVARLFTKCKITEGSQPTIELYLKPSHITTPFLYGINIKLTQDLDGLQTNQVLLFNVTEPWVPEAKRPENRVTSAPVAPRISDIDNRGKATVKFDHGLKSWSSERIEHLNLTDALEIKVIPGRGNEEDTSGKVHNLGLTWEMISLENDTMEIQVYFNATEYISSTPGAWPDQLSIEFKNGKLFESHSLSAAGRTRTVKNATEVTADLKKQLKLGTYLMVFEATKNTVENASKVTMAWTTLLNVFMSGSLQMLWSLVNTLQVLNHLPMLNVQTPAIAMDFQGTMASLSNFDVIPTGDLFDLIFNFTDAEKSTKKKESRALNSETETAEEGEGGEKDEEEEEEEDVNSFADKMPQRFQDMGYESLNIIDNLGTLFLLIIVFAVVLLVLGILKLLSFYYYPSLKWYIELKTVMFWNVPIRFVLEGYLEFAVGSFINVQFLQLSSLSDFFNAAVCVCAYMITWCMPLFVLWFIRQRK